MKVETLRHKDVRGNELCYLKLTNGKGTEHLINVGEKTLKAVEKLNDEDKEVTPDLFTNQFAPKTEGGKK